MQLILVIVSNSGIILLFPLLWIALCPCPTNTYYEEKLKERFVLKPDACLAFLQDFTCISFIFLFMPILMASQVLLRTWDRNQGEKIHRIIRNIVFLRGCPIQKKQVLRKGPRLTRMHTQTPFGTC